LLSITQNQAYYEELYNMSRGYPIIFHISVAFQELKELLHCAPNPRVLTIGSQWSYKTGCDELVPYTIAKHALRDLTKDFADRENTNNGTTRQLFSSHL
jgi:hypothetical protein